MILFSGPINSSESGYHSQRSQNKKAMPSCGAGLDGERGEPMGVGQEWIQCGPMED